MNQNPSVVYLSQAIAGRKAKPQVLIICGSGLSGLANSVAESTKQVVYYKDIPGFPQVTVQGHSGELVFGQISGVECMILRGRFHFYEGHSMETCVLPVRIAKALGCSVMIATNASGGMRPEFNVGDVAVLGDHIGLPTLVGNTPLMGKNDPELGVRFPAMSNAYDLGLQRLAMQCARELGFSGFCHAKATYCCVSGPQYETPAECKMLRLLGADCVGMSTVPEVIAARHAGLRTLALSLITNKVVLPGDANPKHASHEEVLLATEMRGKDVQRLVEQVLSRINRAQDPVADEVVVDSTTAPPPEQRAAKRLRELDIAALTPLQSLQILAELKGLVG